MFLCILAHSDIFYHRCFVEYVLLVHFLFLICKILNFFSLSNLLVHVSYIDEPRLWDKWPWQGDLSYELYFLPPRLIYKVRILLFINSIINLQTLIEDYNCMETKYNMSWCWNSEHHWYINHPFSLNSKNVNSFRHERDSSKSERISNVFF